MNNNEALDLLKETQGMLKGHFCLTSGLHSDTYFQCAKLYQYPEITEKIAKSLAEKLSTLDFDTIIAPAVGAVIMGYETAKQAKKRSLFVERKDGKMELRRGYSLKRGERIVIVEDVITTARTINETLDAIKEYDAELVAVGCIVDRTAGKTDYDIKSVIQMTPVLYKAENCPLCKENIPIEKPGSRNNDKVLAKC
ncbi:MAG: orotate phosphoribosyltransferase [Candidatus Gastranaerophilales bacterium]|nr:orotate phosphoribosyltransferase [Candidatus Gastranaerophilales bacterium]